MHLVWPPMRAFWHAACATGSPEEVLALAGAAAASAAIDSMRADLRCMVLLPCRRGAIALARPSENRRRDAIPSYVEWVRGETTARRIPAIWAGRIHPYWSD